jgi:DNA-binding transcriptional MerR regulator
MDKSADAFRTIGEVAEQLDVPKHVLRFWEGKFPQIKPMKRGGGRRYYRPEDMELLRGIRHLLHAEGYTIKGVDQVKAAVRSAIASAEAESGAKKRGRKRVAAVPAEHSPAAATPKAAGKKPVIDAAADEIILRALHELEDCRAILAGQPPRHNRDLPKQRAAEGR